MQISAMRRPASSPPGTAMPPSISVAPPRLFETPSRSAADCGGECRHQRQGELIEARMGRGREATIVHQAIPSEVTAGCACQRRELLPHEDGTALEGLLHGRHRRPGGATDSAGAPA